VGGGKNDAREAVFVTALAVVVVAYLRAVESWRWIGLAEWISRGFLIRPCAVLSRRGSMFAQWKP
jgi:hypothetical protein